MTNKHKTVKKPSKATPTLNDGSKLNKPYSASIWQKHLVPPPKHPSKNATIKRCSSSMRRLGFRFQPWVSVGNLVLDLRRRVPGVSLNRVLNEGFLLRLGQRSEDELRLRCRLAQLLHEEHELMQTGRVILRSGAFLDPYAAKLIEGNEKLSVKLGRQPLGALTGTKEVNVVKRLLARREAVVQEILDIQNKLLPSEEYVLKSERFSKSRRRRRDKNKPFGMGGA